MFESLSERLNLTFKKLKGQGKLSEANMKEGLREVRLALLEADVHYKVAKDFIDRVKERSLGQEVLASLTPAQQVIKIVQEELTELMGGARQDLNLAGRSPVAIMLAGLQGSGKTTTAGKLALYLKGKNFRPGLVPADVYRPAAIDQLHKVGGQAGVEVYPSDPKINPLELCLSALEWGKQKGLNPLILDTAGRLHIDQALMAELKQIKERVRPNEILLVADAMTGQDAVNVAQKFNEWLRAVRGHPDQNGRRRPGRGCFVHQIGHPKTDQIYRRRRKIGGPGAFSSRPDGLQDTGPGGYPFPGRKGSGSFRSETGHRIREKNPQGNLYSG